MPERLMILHQDKLRKCGHGNSTAQHMYLFVSVLQRCSTWMASLRALHATDVLGGIRQALP